jgi:hypothetical protein
VVHEDAAGIDEIAPGLGKHRGAWGELVACSWLLSQGYAVYRNVSAYGLVDVAAIKGGEVLFLDIKTGKGRLKDKQTAAGVLILGVDADGTCKIEWPRPCIVCGETFRAKVREQRFCTPACQGRYMSAAYLNSARAA